MRASSEQGATYYAMVDGVLLPADRATVSILDDGFLRGDGAFEVAVVYGGRPLALDRHLDRLARTCGALRLPCPRAALEDDVAALIEATGPFTCAVRVVLTRAGRRIVLCEPWSPPSEPSRLLVIRNAQQPLLAGVKSLSYAANMLSRRLAREHDRDDALWVGDDGFVLEAQTAAFFWVSAAGELCTPPLSEPILDSISRRFVIELLPVVERRCPLHEALGAREAFLASTTKEIQAVAMIGDRPLGEVPGPLTGRAAEAYRELVEATCLAPGGQGRP